MNIRFMASLAIPLLAVLAWPLPGRSASYEQTIAAVRQLGAAGQYEKAQAMLISLERRFPNNAELLAFRGRVALWQKKYALAVRCLRRSLAVRKDAAVAAELQHAQNLEQLERATLKEESGELLQAEQVLTRLCGQGRESYESCRRLGLLQLKEGQQAAARQTLLQLRSLYPHDADVALMSLRPLKESGACQQAQQELQELPPDWQQRSDARELLQELLVCRQQQEIKALADQANKRLAQAQVFVDQGQTEKGLQLLLGLLGQESVRYQAGIRAAAIFMREHRYQQAQGLYFVLMRYFPHDTSLGQAYDRAELAALLQLAEEKRRQGDLRAAQNIWQKLFNTGRETYTSGLRLGELLLAQRRYAEAVLLYRELLQRYPNEPGLRGCLLEAYVRKGDIGAARREMLDLAQEERRDVIRTRSDLAYLLKPNNLRVGGGLAGGPREQPLERQVSVSVTQRVDARLSLVVQGNLVERYGKRDTQAIAELYYKPVVPPNLQVMMRGSYSPSATFLPRYTLTGDLTGSVGMTDLLFGVTHMVFADTNALIVSPGITCYFGDPWQLTERFYMNVNNGAFTAATKLGWVPNYQVKGSFGVTAGEASDRIGTAEDLRRYVTLGVTSDIEYRFIPQISLGAEWFFEHREGLYNKAGGSLFGRYWW